MGKHSSHTVGQRGFTLVEMLIVLVIVAIGASLIGPQIFHGIEKVQGKDEEQRLLLLLDSLGMQSFLRNTPETVTFEESELFIESQEVAIDFEYISFPETSLLFNANGFAETSELTYYLGDEEKVATLD